MVFRLVIETIDTPVTGGTRWLGGWRLRKAGALAGENQSDPFDAHPGHHDKGLYPTILDALAVVPQGSDLRIISRMSFLVAELNRSPSERAANGYLRANRKPLSETALLRQLDEIFVTKAIRVSASSPETDIDRQDATDLRVRLSLLKEDVGKERGWQF